MAAPEYDIADWRRRVSALYAEVRAASDPLVAHETWRLGRESLFRNHPQSPLADDPVQVGWPFRTYPYDPDLRLEVALDMVQYGETFATPRRGRRNALASTVRADHRVAQFARKRTDALLDRRVWRRDISAVRRRDQR